MPGPFEITVPTPEREAMVDITERVQQTLSAALPGFSGAVHIFIPHTTAGVTINEGADPAVVRDLMAGLARLAPRAAAYHHGEGNADAHIKASLVGSSVTVPVTDGKLRLGTWQSIYLAEFDGPRTRRVWLTPLSSPTDPASARGS